MGVISKVISIIAPRKEKGTVPVSPITPNIPSRTATTKPTITTTTPKITTTTPTATTKSAPALTTEVTTTTSKPKVFYSSNPKWVAPDANSVTVYITGSGNLTGKTSSGDISNKDIQGNIINVKAEGQIDNKPIGNIGTFLAKNMALTTTTQTQNITSFDKYGGYSIIPKLTGQVSFGESELRKDLIKSEISSGTLPSTMGASLGLMSTPTQYPSSTQGFAGGGTSLGLIPASPSVKSTKPTMESIIPTTWFGKTIETAKTLYVASPFGASTPLSEEYNIARTTGASKYFNVLTFGEAKSAVRGESLKQATAKYQLQEIEKFQSSLNIANLTPEQKYYSYESGLLRLSTMGITPKETTLITGEKGITFISSALTPSISTDVFQWRGEKTGLGKALLGTRIVSTGFVKNYALSIGVESTGVIQGAGRGISYLTAGGLGTAGKYAGYGIKTLVIGGIAGITGYGKTMQYINAPEKSVFWLQTAGEVGGIAAYLQASGYGFQVPKYETEAGKSARVFAFRSTPLITKSEAGYSLGLPEKNPFGTTLPSGIFETPLGAKIALKYAPTLDYLKPSFGEVVTEGYAATKTLRGVKYQGTGTIDFSKSNIISEFSPEAQKATIKFLQEEGAKSTGWRGLGNAIINRNRMLQIYGSTSTVSQGALQRQMMDLDLQFSGAGIPKAQKLYGILSKISPGQFRAEEGSALIEFKTKAGTWVHAFDIHGVDVPDTMVSGTPLGFRQLKPTTIKLEGKEVPISVVGQEATAKGASTLTFRTTPLSKTYVAPEEHRIKDIADWYNILTSLNKQAGTKGISLSGFESALKTSYGKDILTGGGTIMFAATSYASPSAAGAFVSPILGISKASKISTNQIITTPSNPSLSRVRNIISPMISTGISSKISSPSYQSIISSPFISTPPSPSPSTPSPSPPSPSPPSPPSYTSYFSSYSPSPSPSPSPSFYTIISPSSIPVLTNFVGGLFPEEKKRKQTNLSRKYKYTPSIGAVGLGLKASKVIGAETGLFTRYILTGKPYKKRKK